MFVVLVDSWRKLDMKKLSNRLRTKPVEWCCLKVNRFLLRLRILQTSQRSRFSVICINFLLVLFLMTGLSPSESREGLKFTLKSPPNTALLHRISSKVSGMFIRSFNVCSCSDPVLAF